MFKKRMTSKSLRRMAMLVVVPTLIAAPMAHADAQSRAGKSSVEGSTVGFSVPPLPTVSGPVPRTATSIPLGTAYLPGAPGSLNLADHGYREDEYFLSGTANVYEYNDAGDGVRIKEPDVPYTTVILVRRPIHVKDFSGRVQLEMGHPQFGATTQMWAHSNKKFMREGDAWVRITNSRGGPTGSSLAVLQQYDPERYASLAFPEDGLNWDVIGQVGELLKSNTPASPLNPLKVKQIFMGGFSGSGAITQMWINDFSQILRRPDGSSIMDGYVVGEPSGYPLINSQAERIAADDPRQAVIPPGVPVVKLHSRPEPAAQQRPDSDTFSDRYRTYEVAGAAHTDNYTNPLSFPTFIQEQATEWGQANLYPFMCQWGMNDFPYEQQWNLAISVIEKWSEQSARSHGPRWSPPRADRIELNADGSIAKDEFGNDLGGVRSVAVDVPIATYFDTNTSAAR